jgi:hypothetical protein
VSRPICEIAAEIRRCWRPPGRIYFGAVPYLEAMADLCHVDDFYGADSARSVVVYFLANAHSFRGPDARRLKAELKALL